MPMDPDDGMEAVDGRVNKDYGIRHGLRPKHHDRVLGTEMLRLDRVRTNTVITLTIAS